MADDAAKKDLQKAGQEYQQRLSDALARQSEPKPAPETSYGMPLKSVYTPEDATDGDYMRDLGFPGDYPFTRGIRPDMYRGRLWTMRQYAGFDTVEETNSRFRHLLDQGLTGMNVAFDLPTQLGMDPDHPQATSEVGKVGISCPSVRQMGNLFQELPLKQVTPSLTVNASAQSVLSMYVVTAQNQGIPLEQIGGTTQNDILKEFIARGNYIFPPGPSLKMSVDLFEYCAQHLPRWNFINICGYHVREAGSSLVQELAFAFGNACAYLDEALSRGMAIDDFAPRIAFNFSVFNNVLEEVAKFRAARRLWARLLKERYGAKNPRSLTFRTGAGSGGSTLVAQQPGNNVVRVTLHTVIAAMAGVQSMHTASMDEAHALPSEEAATLALRTQQIVAYESGLADVIDPLGGSYYVENLTDQIEEQAEEYLKRIEERGGMVSAIESGWVVQEIGEEAYRFQREVERGERVVVGLNRFTTDETPPIQLHSPDPSVANAVKKEISDLRSQRDEKSLVRALDDLKSMASEGGNLMPATLEAIRSLATVGEVSGALREVFGEWQAPSV
ncbi:MAG: methylmalonyl-CoA mutase [SAR202 cluster bacterium]|nr:methylmalonyl-CoA mutase family protein [Dehalococcoidia bacterium]MQG61539.1 methylmalonyl-CoA mutase [SAR202 cluster bacterium]|tara:strand:- start:80 stop:1753 length:1674 start_codon:yes stop_codon:yes gene_type:complete